MENAPKIYQAMCDAMADIHAVAKEQQNVQQKFRYRGIDDAMNALSPILKKHRLFLVPEVLAHEREERQTKGGGNLIYSILRVKYSMYTDDGSCVAAVVVGEGMDSGDKASNKAIAAAMKYAIYQMFCIPTEDMANDDPDRTSPEPSTAKSDFHTPHASKPFRCVDCGGEVGGVELSTGERYSPAEIAEKTVNKYGRCLCWSCSTKARAAS